MSIIIKSKNDTYPISSGSFVTEDELQKLLAGRTDLLKQESEPQVALVKRELSLGDAGSLDIFLINADGLPIAVEVKLQRNAQARREVVAQAIDYISALTNKTVDELDEETHGKVTEAIQEFAGDSDENFDRIWRALAANLRAGLARLIVAVDGPTPGLERILRFLAEKSELDVQLVIVERYMSPENFEVIVARPTFTQASVSRSVLTRDNSDLLDAVNKYNEMADSQFKAVGAGANYRQIRPLSWPPNLRTHYEFYQTQPHLGVELHIESDQAKPIAKILQTLGGKVLDQTKKELIWDPAWSSGRGRLRVVFDRKEDPQFVATAMKELIGLTYPTVTPELKSIAAKAS